MAIGDKSKFSKMREKLFTGTRALGPASLDSADRSISRFLVTKRSNAI